MAHRTRIPFWTTALTSLALMACMHAPEPEVGTKTPTVGRESQRDFNTGEVAQAHEGEEDEAKAVAEEPSVSIVRGARTESAPTGDTGSGGAVAVTVPMEEPSDRAARHPVTPRPSPQSAPAKMAPASDPYPAGSVGGLATLSGPPRPDVAPPPATSEQYTDYGVNGFALTANDHLSTFAVDVDTASYAVTRRKLGEGYLPPASAVRVEEFVNYFPYEYRQPAKGDPFAVDFEATPSPWNPRNQIVRIGVQGKKVSYTERKPVHLTFLVDVSGSMRSQDKIELLKKSLIMLTEELEDGDTVAISTYAGHVGVVLEPTPISERATIIRSLERLTAGGSTAMASGIDTAYRLADATFVPGDVNRVIICSDGDANVGTTSHEIMSRQIRQYAEKGITLTTLGFGNGNYKDTMMERLANDGDGNYFYLDSESEARRVLVDKMTGTLEVIAKDVKIQVDWDPTQVIAYRLIGYENRDIADKDFRNDKVDAGEIGAGHQVTALYEVALKDDPTGTLATVRVRNKAPGPEAPAVERSFSLGADALKDSFAEGSAQYRIAFASASFAEVLRGSPHVAEVSLRDVEQIARSAARAEYREDAELVRLIDRAATLRGEGNISRR